MPCRIVLAVVTACALAACQTAKPDGSAAAPGVETVRYTTANVSSGFALTDERLSSFPVTLSGKLWLPEGDGPFPVVSGGIRAPSTVTIWRNGGVTCDAALPPKASSSSLPIPIPAGVCLEKSPPGG